MTDNHQTTTGAITKKLRQQPPHIQAGVAAYRAALNRRQDWHSAVIAAIETSISLLKEKTDA
jgi:hypothetical protein